VNDYGVEGWDGKTTGDKGIRGRRFFDFMMRILKMLRKRKHADVIPRLRVGFQAHFRSGGQLSSGAAKEPLDFDPSSIRKQVARFKKKGLRICVTECDLELPEILVGRKKRKLVVDHLRYVATGVKLEKGLPKPGTGTPKDEFVKDRNGFTATYFANAITKKRYDKAFTVQRDLARDAIGAILSSGNVESFIWWDLEDDLPVKFFGGANFRYHGYLFHRHLVCPKCKDDAAMQMHYDNGDVIYKKPKYWGAVAAFKSPRRAVI
jgi:hypothetical protein